MANNRIAFGAGSATGRVVIVMYHSVNQTPDAYSVTPAVFRQHLEAIRDHYPVVALKDITSHLTGGPTTKVVITFDDAFEDFLTEAYPILLEFGIPATLFVPTGFIGRSNLWDLHTTHVTPKNIMGVNALRKVCADGLVDLGSHTVDHVNMRGLCQSDMSFQAGASKKWLEDTFGKAINMFSYPYGQRDHVSALTRTVIADHGYEIAVTTCWGANTSLSRLLALRRIHFNQQDDRHTVLAKIEGRYDWIGLKERLGFVSRSAIRALRHSASTYLT